MIINVTGYWPARHSEGYKIRLFVTLLQKSL